MQIGYNSVHSLSLIQSGPSFFINSAGPLQCEEASCFLPLLSRLPLYPHAVWLNFPWRDACTRAVYFGKEKQTVTGRSMDWVEDMQTNLWAFPRGMKRDGGLGKGSLEWTSKYGSIVASVYEGGSADGMNEQGLVANMLYLAESEYPSDDDKRPGVCISAWTQYFLDNFSSVEDAVTEAKEGVV